MASANNRPTQPVKELTQSNVVKGRVEIQGTGTGVHGLILRAYDVIGTRDSAGTQERRPLGSTLINQGPFEIWFDDELLLKGWPDGSRPDLLVSVIAPEARTHGTADPPKPRFGRARRAKNAS